MLSPAASSSSRPRVVVLGGGYAGLKTLEELKGAPVDVVLVDQKPYHTQKTRLWQVAVGQGSESTQPLPELAQQSGAQLVVGEVAHIDPLHHQVQLREQGSIRYDYLVVALGSRPSPAPAENVMSLDQPEDALRIRETVRRQAESVLAGQGRLPIVVVGGGATGVELAGVVHEVVEQVHPDLLQRLDLRLVHSRPQLSGMPEEAARRSAEALHKLGVELKLGERVMAVRPGEVELKSGEVLPADCVLWATGTRAPELLTDLGGNTDAAGRVEVNPDLSLPGHPEIFVVGDAALVRCQGQGVPPSKRAAFQEASRAAGNIRHSLAGEEREAFVYTDGKEWTHIGPVDL